MKKTLHKLPEFFFFTLRITLGGQL